jgi:nitrous oxidase accessory protein NosD
MIRRTLAAATVALAAVLAWAWGTRAAEHAVAPGASVMVAIANASEGDVIRLAPGVHAPFDVTRRVEVVADAGAVVRGPIQIFADGTELRDVRVEGGETGIAIVDADRVVLERVSVIGARLHGIEVSPGSATVRDCTIAGLVSPYAQGFEVRWSSGRPKTIVEGCAVSSGQEGIVSHVSHVEFRRNVVTDTTLRALVVTEMSEGIVQDNEVRGVVGSGIYCGDMSHCEIRGNVVRGVDASPDAAPALAGWGIVGFFHSTLRTHDNTIEGAVAGPMRLSMDTHEVDHFPLRFWAPGWAGLWPGGAVATGLGLLVAAAAVALARPLVRRLPRPRPARPYGEGAWGLVVAALAVQAFHMLEHGVQVWQVYVLNTKIRAGVLGQAVNIEWVHFTYNLAVLAFVWWLAVSLWRGRWGGARSGLAFLVAAAGLQTYHFAEHVVKLAQHLQFRIDPAPGIVGGRLGLVYFHYAINLAVFVAMTVGAWPLLRRARSHVVERRPVRVAVGA